MKHIEIEITYDTIPQLKTALEYVSTHVRHHTSKPIHELEIEVEKSFKLKFCRTDHEKVLSVKNDLIKEPDRIETNENGQTVLIYKSKM